MPAHWTSSVQDHERHVFLIPVSVSVCRQHGRSSPGGGLPVHRHSRWHRPTAVPRGPAAGLPLRPALLEEEVHKVQGTSPEFPFYPGGDLSGRCFKGHIVITVFITFGKNSTIATIGS